MRAGHRFERTIRWSKDEIKAYADVVGDTNQLHHDDAYAEASRFGGLIASGSQTVAFLMAFCASQTTGDRPGVGLEFTFRLTGPARPDEDIVLSWEVVSTERSEKPKGTIVKLTGAARGGGGRSICTAAATALMFDVV